MAFPPGVTIKDYTWGGLAGYLNPRRGAKPERFPTVIQIVRCSGLDAIGGNRLNGVSAHELLAGSTESP